jgi:hypothetical protein
MNTHCKSTAIQSNPETMDATTDSFQVVDSISCALDALLHLSKIVHREATSPQNEQLFYNIHDAIFELGRAESYQINHRCMVSDIVCEVIGRIDRNEFSRNAILDMHRYGRVCENVCVKTCV